MATPNTSAPDLQPPTNDDALAPSFAGSDGEDGDGAPARESEGSGDPDGAPEARGFEGDAPAVQSDVDAGGLGDTPPYQHHGPLRHVDRRSRDVEDYSDAEDRRPVAELEGERSSRRRKVVWERPGLAPSALFHLIGNTVFLRIHSLWGRDVHEFWCCACGEWIGDTQDSDIARVLIPLDAECHPNNTPGTREMRCKACDELFVVTPSSTPPENLQPC